jgi:hypothetical protein
VNEEGRAGMLGTEVDAAVWRAVLRLARRGPETTTRCQGWMLEFEGESWASWRAVVKVCFGTGVETNLRVECRFLIASSRSTLDGNDASSAAMV